MCDYCEEDKIMLRVNTISASCWGWGGPETKVTLEDAEEYPKVETVFVDRGYLRLVPIDDSQCMDSGEKIKINFCPMCGEGSSM